ncbi:MAG: hypothetical protein HFH14_00965 [Lachnospiraceae bacterium]|nr:hypothetical protein [Lachnospiraceae bacterium]
MAKFIITVEGGKITQTLNFLDRNLKDNRYVYGNGNESGIMDKAEEIYSDIPECDRIAENYRDLLGSVDLGRSQITSIMRELNELEKELSPYNVPEDKNEQEHVIVLNNEDLEKLAFKCNSAKFTNDKNIEEAIKSLIHKD